MERGKQSLDEIHVFDGSAERTGNLADPATLRRHPRVCKTMRELVRKYKSLGDGIFYLIDGQWPEGETKVSLETKWIGMS